MVLIDIIIKAPNQRQDDQTIQCQLEWTVHQLKSHLSAVYPTKPRIEDQRLIYSGHLLKNEQSLRDVLQPIDDNLTFTIHMVCAQSSNDSPKRTNPMATNANSANTNPSTNVTNNSSQSSNESTRTADNANTFQLPTNGQFMNFNTVNPNLFNMGVSSPVMLPPMAPDQWHQMAQAYSQYMAQYITQYQYLNQVVPNNPIPPNVLPVPPMVVPQANDAMAAPNAVAAQPQPPVQRLNAGPGQQVIDDEEEQRNRDWLDYFYWMSRAVVLFSIIYFYSSFTRFMFVVFLSLLLYLYQTNWFNNNRQQQPQQQNIVNNNNNENAVNREEQDRIANDETEVVDRVRPQPTNNSEVTDDRVTEDRFTGLRFFWVFVSSLFTSLIPDNPAVPVNIN